MGSCAAVGAHGVRTTRLEGGDDLEVCFAGDAGAAATRGISPCESLDGLTGFNPAFRQETSKSPARIGQSGEMPGPDTPGVPCLLTSLLNTFPCKLLGIFWHYLLRPGILGLGCRSFHQKFYYARHIGIAPDFLGVDRGGERWGAIGPTSLRVLLA